MYNLSILCQADWYARHSGWLICQALWLTDMPGTLSDLYARQSGWLICQALCQTDMPGTLSDLYARQSGWLICQALCQTDLVDKLSYKHVFKRRSNYLYKYLYNCPQYNIIHLQFDQTQGECLQNMHQDWCHDQWWFGEITGWFYPNWCQWPIMLNKQIWAKLYSLSPACHRNGVFNG